MRHFLTLGDLSAAEFSALPHRGNVDPAQLFAEIDTDGYDGLWAPYPYLPSGTILGNDRQRGLFIWQLPTATTTGDASWMRCEGRGPLTSIADVNNTLAFALSPSFIAAIASKTSR